MAKATIETQEQTKLVTVKVPVGVTLNLTYEEAQVLKVVCSKIGGHPDTTPRGYMENINTALESAGVEDVSLPVDPHQNAIYFTPFKL